MNTSPIIDIFQTFFYKGVMILMPVAGVSMIVVIIIAVIMAMMQIQEQTLTFFTENGEYCTRYYHFRSVDVSRVNDAYFRFI